MRIKYPLSFWLRKTLFVCFVNFKDIKNKVPEQLIPLGKHWLSYTTAQRIFLENLWWQGIKQNLSTYAFALQPLLKAASLLSYHLPDSIALHLLLCLINKELSSHIAVKAKEQTVVSIYAYSSPLSWSDIPRQPHPWRKLQESVMKHLTHKQECMCKQWINKALLTKFW